MNITIGNHAYACDISESGKITFDNRADFTSYIHDIIQKLQEDLPVLFPENPQPKLPLAIGIHKVLADWADDKGISQRNLEIALHYWMKGKRYQAALKAGKELGVRFGVGYTWKTVSIHPYGRGKHR